AAERVLSLAWRKGVRPNQKTFDTMIALAAAAGDLPAA
ncbi:hypothetical protein AK812_SmicGene47185, partial [Symbiodinium microadriaticum]